MRGVLAAGLAGVALTACGPLPGGPTPTPTPKSRAEAVRASCENAVRGRLGEVTFSDQRESFESHPYVATGKAHAQDRVHTYRCEIDDQASMYAVALTHLD